MVAKRLCVIPARGGSKRIPRKNIRDFLGLPMIAWTILAAKESELFDRVVVSTDDPEIAQISVDYGAEVPFLRDTAFDDITPVSEATLATMRQSISYWSEEYLSVTQLMPNCPLRNAQDIRSAISAFESKQRKAQISCFRFGWMNPWWSFELDALGDGSFSFPQAIGERSQDLPELFCPTGAVWVALCSELETSGSYYSPSQVFEPMRWEGAVDIDDEADFRFALAVAGLATS